MWSFLITICLLSYFVVKVPSRRLGSIANFLLIVFGILHVIVIADIARFIISPAPNNIASPMEKESLHPSARLPTNLPAVYYIIPDGLVRSDILRTMYDYDNSEFVTRLVERGFYVPDSSCANYMQTALSLSSTLATEYLQTILGEELKESTSKFPLKFALALLKSLPTTKAIRLTGFEQAGLTYLVINVCSLLAS